MYSKDITAGKKYALRGPKESSGFQCVRPVEYIQRGKWLVEWVEPRKKKASLIYSKDILCEWSERNKYAKDERRAQLLREDTVREWPGEEHPLDTAAYEVLFASGEAIDFSKGILSGYPDSLNRIAERARFKWPSYATSYTDRCGVRYCPWVVALALAKAFAAAEPSTVLLRIELDERKWEVQTRAAGGSHMLPLLEHYRAAWAIIRDWVGQDARGARLEAEVRHLRQLIDQTVWKLRTGNPHEAQVANWLSRSVKGE